MLKLAVSTHNTVRMKARYLPDETALFSMTFVSLVGEATTARIEARVTKAAERRMAIKEAGVYKATSFKGVQELVSIFRGCWAHFIPKKSRRRSLSASIT